mmetsp:Transcript_10817/g.28075  ORF Transcript_10817/g.28075 Transcript_10817/m.28075 type:complete len:214 (+) Transcript_10817:1483-2124(+)
MSTLDSRSASSSTSALTDLEKTPFTSPLGSSAFLRTNERTHMAHLSMVFMHTPMCPRASQYRLYASVERNTSRKPSGITTIWCQYGGIRNRSLSTHHAPNTPRLAHTTSEPRMRGMTDPRTLTHALIRFTVCSSVSCSGTLTKRCCRLSSDVPSNIRCSGLYAREYARCIRPAGVLGTPSPPGACSPFASCHTSSSRPALDLGVGGFCVFERR